MKRSFTLTKVFRTSFKNNALSNTKDVLSINWMMIPGIKDTSIQCSLFHDCPSVCFNGNHILIWTNRFHFLKQKMLETDVPLIFL